MEHDRSLAVIVMGVAGAGKTTVAAELSKRTGWLFLEGDDFHPAENIAKQAAGLPLDNSDRRDWIDALGDAANKIDASKAVIISCSALNPFVRERLCEKSSRPCIFVWLDVPRHILKDRLEARTDHFMPATLLDDQLQALQPPKDGIRINGNQPVDIVCQQVLSELKCHEAN